MTHPYLNLDEVAELYRCHPSTVRRWYRQGRLEALKFPGGKLMFPVTQPALVALRSAVRGAPIE